METIEQLTVHIQLELHTCSIADPDGSRAPVADEMIQRRLWQVAFAGKAVHDLELPWFAMQRDLADPLHKAFTIFDVACQEQSIGGKACITDPGVAVVPVADAADLLRQRCGWCCDHRACRYIGQEFQRHRAAHHGLLIGTAVATTRSPGTPEGERVSKILQRSEQRVRLRAFSHIRQLEHKRDTLAPPYNCNSAC